MATMGISFQPNLLGVMSQFSQFQETLKKHIAIATEKSGGRIGDGMIQYMDFQNPTGALEGSIGEILVTEYEAWIGPQGYFPYDWRRDRGFSGMTDSLGRYFPDDPGVFYAENALDDTDVLLDVANNYIDAVYAAWEECIGKLPSGQTSTVAQIL